MNNRTLGEWRKKFGENLASLMYEAKYTVEDMSKMTGFSEDIMNDILYNNKFWPGLKITFILSEVLGCEPSKLLHV